MMKKIYLYRFLLFALSYLFTLCCFAQSDNISVDYSLSLEGALSSGDYTPYMLTANRFDVLSPRANTGYISANITGSYVINDQWSFDGGITAMGSTHSNHQVYLQELYLKSNYKKIYLELGSRQRSSPVINQLLSSGDFIFSGNAKPIPSIHISTEGFVTLPFLHNWIETSADFGYGRLFEGDWIKKRFDDYHALHVGSFYTTDVSYHHKQLFLRTNSRKKIYGTIGMQHSVFFGGIKTSYESGSEIVSGNKAKFQDYFRVLIPKSDGSNKLNAGDSFVYGNHVGVWYGDIAYNQNSTNRYRIYFEKPFEDGSGIAFRNGLDGIWGFEYSKESSTPSFLKGIVLEYIQTTNQSGPIHWAPHNFDIDISTVLPNEATGADNYYNNFYYNGFSYYGLSIGSALLKSPYYNEDNYLCYIDNRIQAWHIGVSGDFSPSLGYLFKASYREGLGTYFVPLSSIHHSFDSILQLTWTHGPWQCAASYALTQGNIYGCSNGFDLKVVFHGKIL